MCFQLHTEQSFSKRVDHGQVVTGAAANQKIEGAPLSQLRRQRTIAEIKVRRLLLWLGRNL